MKRILILLLLTCCFGAACSLLQDKKSPYSDEERWVSVYLASWKHNVSGVTDGKVWGNMFTDDIDWDAFTHMFYFALQPNPDGSLGPVADYENINPDRLQSIITAAHENNKPILLTIGGYESRDNFIQAYADSNRSEFIQNILSIKNQWGFDGIDLDIQPLQIEDDAGVIKFVNDLYAALQKESTPILDKPLLTASVTGNPDLYSFLQDKFDQINIATYNMSRPFSGWVTWHNTPLYNGGMTFPENGFTELPSIENTCYQYINAGIERKKLGIAASFYGYEWSGVREPMQGWETGDPPLVPVYGGTEYHILYENYDMENSLWDKKAKVPYLSIFEPSTFVSFDNETSIKEKMDFIRREGLGGMLVWEIAGGWVESESPGNQDHLLQAVKQELNRYNESNN